MGCRRRRAPASSNRPWRAITAAIASLTGTSAMARVLLTRRIPSSVLTLLQAEHAIDLYSDDGAIPRDELLRRVADKDALICLLTDKVDAAVMDAAPSLKIVSNIAVGYDNIDVAAAKARGVIVTNTPDVLTESVAEFTWALILGTARRVAEGDRLIRANAWKGWGLDFMLGMELGGKQLGIIGGRPTGRARARKRPPSRHTRLLPGRPGGPEVRDPARVSIDELLVTSDVISLHTPGTPETRDRKSTRLNSSHQIISYAVF